MGEQGYEQFRQQLDVSGAGDRLFVILTLLRAHPDKMADLALALVERDLGRRLHDTGNVPKIWQTITRLAPDRVTDPTSFARWEAGASAMLDALGSHLVPYEFAQDLLSRSGQALDAARSLGVLAEFCRRAGDALEVDMFWRQAGEELLAWAMKLDDLEAVRELALHASPDQGLGPDGNMSWVQLWVQTRSLIPYLPQNQHEAMLAHLVAWGADVEKTNTNATPLMLASQDVNYATRCRETIHSLISAGARWELLDHQDVDARIRQWLYEHPLVRKAQLEGLAQDSRPPMSVAPGARKI